MEKLTSVWSTTWQPTTRGGRNGKAVFMQVTASGLRESHPHDVTITEEPVNYHST